MAIYDSNGTKLHETANTDTVLLPREELKELRRIADAAEQRAEIAERQAKAAEERATIAGKEAEAAQEIAAASKKQAESAQKAATAAQEQTELAKAEAESAKKQSWISTGLSILAIIVSLADIVISIILR